MGLRWQYTSMEPGVVYIGASIQDFVWIIRPVVRDGVKKYVVGHRGDDVGLQFDDLPLAIRHVEEQAKETST